MDSDHEQGPSRKKIAKERREKQKLSSVQEKYKHVRLTPSKFQAVFDDLSGSSSDETDVGIDTDASSEHLETETADEDFDSDESEESDVETATRARRGTGARPRARRTRRTTRTPAPTDSDDGWCSDNTEPFVDNFTGTPGLTVPVPSTVLGFIQLFLTQKLLKYVAYETNLYASQSKAGTGQRTEHRWQPVTVKEIARYLGLTILIGIFPLPRLRMYWQTGRFWHIPCFNTFITGKRFEMIAKYFHVYNNKSIPPGQGVDKLIKVRSLMQYLLNRFKRIYIPNKKLSLDEGTMPWRGRLSFKTYNPNKPDKYGIRLYMLAEATSGYIYDFKSIQELGKTIDTVMALIEPLKDKGYHLYMDNYYNSVRLSEALLQVGVYTCGTLRLQRGAPKSLQMQAKGKVPVDKTLFKRKDNTFIILWKDKRIVSLITNCHNAETQRVQRRKRVRNRDGTTSVQQVTVNKPNAICDYNTNMKGVDHFDQMIKYYHFTRKTHKWTKKMTFYFVQMAIYNAFVMCNYYTTDRRKLTLLHFHEQVIAALLFYKSSNWPEEDDDIPHAADVNATGANVATPGPSTPRPPTAGPSGVRRPLFTSPVPADLPSSSESEDEAVIITSGASAATRPRIVDNPYRLKRNLSHTQVKIQKRLRCRVCKLSGKRKDTHYKCKTCDVALCPAPCYSYCTMQ
ncbi:piggyBac transposable element-derived protein 4-like [Procambarus clarkii]|uniref:piggyBac transposable element-derived protein 4-like n=1 Tax=Procambarus clarkii TaxID=6728 RepID=UPI003743D3B9